MSQLTCTYVILVDSNDYMDGPRNDHELFQSMNTPPAATIAPINETPNLDPAPVKLEGGGEGFAESVVDAGDLAEGPVPL